MVDINRLFQKRRYTLVYKNDFADIVFSVYCFSMIVDGRAIANEWLDELKKKTQLLPHRPQCVIFSVAPDMVTHSYLSIKKKKAAFVGIDIVLETLPPTVSQDELIEKIESYNQKEQAVLVQLPLPSQFDSTLVCNALSAEVDVDALSDATNFESPVVLAIKRLLATHHYVIEGKNVAIVGFGKLVGKPIERWLNTIQVNLTVVTADSPKEVFYDALASADVIISGAGSPELITPGMITDDVVILDAGTSESNGKILGDFSSACQDKAFLYTPVPGGIGPITIAALLANIVAAHEKD